MHVFNERGLMPPEPFLPIGSPVNVSSGDHSSEATLEGEGETYPLAADLLCALPDDNAAGDYPVSESQAPAGVTMRSGGM